jgi:hypothetical protein
VRSEGLVDFAALPTQRACCTGPAYKVFGDRFPASAHGTSIPEPIAAARVGDAGLRYSNLRFAASAACLAVSRNDARSCAQ